MINLLAAVVMASAAPAAAPAAAIDPAAMQAATALVAQLDVKSQVLASMGQNIQMMRSGVAMRSMLAQQPGFIPAYQANKARFDAALQKAGGIQANIAEKVIRENSQAVVNEAARAYARNYTAAELRGLAAFFQSPLGKALNGKQPRVTAEISNASAQLLGSRIDAGMKAAAPQLQAALAPLNAAPPAATPATKKK